jgi:hypothetical protein
MCSKAKKRARGSGANSQGTNNHTNTTSSQSQPGSLRSGPNSHPSQPSTTSGSSSCTTELALHPHFLRLPATVPLTYHLLLQVCLSMQPSNRLSFREVVQLLLCVKHEVDSGSYVDVLGRTQVPPPRALPAASTQHATRHRVSCTLRRYSFSSACIEP